MWIGATGLCSLIFRLTVGFVGCPQQIEVIWKLQIKSHSQLGLRGLLRMIVRPPAQWIPRLES